MMILIITIIIVITIIITIIIMITTIIIIIRRRTILIVIITVIIAIISIMIGSTAQTAPLTASVRPCGHPLIAACASQGTPAVYVYYMSCISVWLYYVCLFVCVCVFACVHV